MTVRTTVRLPEDLLRQAKRKAAAEGKSLTSLIEQGLRLVISAKAGRLPKRNNPPVSTATGGLRPGFSWEQLAFPAEELDDLEYLGRIKRSE